MTMGCIGPRWRRKSDKVVTEVDEGLYVRPVVEVVVFYATERYDNYDYIVASVIEHASKRGRGEEW